MYQLSSSDAAFLHMETAEVPMHIAAVQVMELPQGVSETAFIESLKKFLLARIDRVPYLTQRLQSLPLGIDQPVWVKSEDFEIDRHVYRVEVPAPGGQAELEQTVAKLHEQRLDRAYPLWEHVVLCGLANGRIAYCSRVHHACIDGMAGQAATRLLMDPTPEHLTRPFPTDENVRHDNHSLSALWATAAEHFAKGAISATTNSLSGLDALARVAQRALDPKKGFGAAFEPAPRTRFNRKISANRGYAAGELPLADIKALAKVAGCTVNDVFLAVCAGGLRRYLRRTGEDPKRSLLAGCPVSLGGSARNAAGNAVSMLKVSLGTHLSDPAERLAHVRQSALTAKGLLSDAAGLLANDIALPGMPSIQQTLARASERLGLGDWLDPAVNLLISNVPGPRRTLYSNGAKMLTHYPVSIPAHGNGLNITVQSYVDGLYFSVTSCTDAVPEAAVLRDDLLAAFAQLCAALPSSIVPIVSKGASEMVASEHQATNSGIDGASKQVA